MRLNRLRLEQSLPGIAGLLRGLAVVGVLALSVCCFAGTQTNPSLPAPKKSSAKADAMRIASARATFAKLPMIFEANQGQSDPQVKFLARGSGYGLFLTQDAAVLSLRKPVSHSGENSAAQQAVLRMELQGSSQAVVTGSDRLPGTSSYFIGNDPNRWHRNIPQFGEVSYADVYPGVDLVYYGKQGQLEYDFRVAPNADASQVKLHFDGADHLQLASNGDLLLGTSGGDVRLQVPQVYQQSGAERSKVEGRYVLLSGNNVGFALGNYDRSRELVIDPVLTYSTYLGGTGNEACSQLSSSGNPVSQCPGIAVDSISNVYIAGVSTSADFPNPTAPPTLTGTANVFIAKLNITATGAAQLVNSIFLGGNKTDIPSGIVVDSGFRVIVTGTTSSTNFPVINEYPVTPTPTSNHIFVTKLDLTANTLLYSTYLAGNGIDSATGLAIDASADIYVTGTTTSTDVPSQSDVFPSTLGSFQSASRGTSQFFFTKINPFSSGVNSILYSSYFGGGNPINGKTLGGGIAVDVAGDVYLTGGTNFLNTQNNNTTDFPILNPLQTCLDTPVNPSGTCSVALTATDAFVAKFAPVTGSTNQFTLNYSTYIGGTGDDVGNGIAVDTAADVYVTGSTTSNDFVLPTGTTPFQPANNGGANDAFVAKFSSFTPVNGITSTQAVPLLYFSYLGGSGNDVALAVSSDDIGGAYLAGYTDSPNFPTNNGMFTALGGAQDGFVARLDTTATVSTIPSQFMSYLGGGANDAVTSIVRDTQDGTVVAGETFSSNFPLMNPFQGTLSGTSDAFITRLGPSVNLTMAGSPAPSPAGVGNQITFTYTITNNGDALSSMTFTDHFPTTGVSLVTGTSSGGACGTGTAGVLTCTVGGVAGGGATTTVTVLMTPSSGGSLGNSATLTAAGCPTQTCASAQSVAAVSDFAVNASPAVASPAPAGQPVPYEITVTPTGPFPESVTLSCSSTLPTGTTCTFTNNPITTLSGAQSRSLVINTTARTTTISQSIRLRNIYAAFLPISGLALFGTCFAGIGGRKRRLLITLFIIGLLGTVALQAGCGSSGSITTVSGTPAGTYNVTITATSGSASRTTVLTFTVQ